MTRLFGTSGVRGTIDGRMTPELAAKLGLAFASFLGNEGEVAVVRDVRPQSQPVQMALVAGLTAGGVDVVELGVAPSSLVSFAIKELGFKGGVSVTGSHTIPPITGVLFFLGDSGELGLEEQDALETIIKQSSFERVPWNEVGSVRREDLFELYVNFVAKHCARADGYKVVVDPGNGASCGYLERALEALGCEVSAINASPDGSFPSRDPYPRPEVLGALSAKVKELKADLGVATDGDGDRAIFATSDGEVLWGDVTGALLAVDTLIRKCGGKVVCPINTSRAVEEAVKLAGGSVVTTKVGPPAIVSALRREDGVVMGMEETGKCIWPDIALYGDAAVTTGMLLRVVSSTGKGLKELAAQIPHYYRRKVAIDCPDELKEKVLTAATELWIEEGEVGEVIALDGLKVNLTDGSWVLLRPSGTEPVFRCYVEAPTEERAEELLRAGLSILERALRRARDAKVPSS